MKNNTLLLLLLFITISCKKNTDEIDFKVGYSPNFQYIQTQKQLVENAVKYIASDEILENLKINGISNPDTTKSYVKLKSVLRTGRELNNSFPVNVEFIESNHSSLKKGTKLYGKSIKGVTKIDSISALDMTAKAKEAMLFTLENMMNEIKYPEQKVKIGESFENKTSMNMPISLPINIEVESIYTLKKIENGIGYFDLNHKIKSKTKDYRKSLVGIGKGKIHYDIERNFFIKLYSEMKIDVEAELDGFSIKLGIESIADQNTEIQNISE